MKTVFLSFGYSILLLLVFLNPNKLLGNDGHTTNQSLDYFDDFENDNPASYAARIKRFHHAQEGLDYFDPVYTNDINYLPSIGNKISTKKERQLISPYHFKHFHTWAKTQNSFIIWQYANDENYRKLIDTWNQINNPYWTYAITVAYPFGTFDFRGGLIHPNAPFCAIIGNNPRNARFSQNNNSISVRRGDVYSFEIINQLPMKVQQKTVTSQQLVEIPNFTKHVPIYLEWHQGRGVSNGFNKKDAFINSIQQNAISKKADYNSLSSTSGFGSLQENSANNNQYNDM